MENYADRCELDEMKQQIQLLKDKLAKEIIVSEKLRCPISTGRRSSCIFL